MAMSFLDQLLNFTGLKLPEGKERYDPSVYRQEVVKQEDASRSAAAGTTRTRKSSVKEQAGEELTGVARYMAKKQQNQPEPVAGALETIAETKESGLTGVAKYLAKLESEAQARAEAETVEWENMSSVERYLAKLEGRKIPAPAVKASKTKAPEKKEEVKPLTRVERYLSEQPGAASAKGETSEAKPAPEQPKPAVSVKPKAEKTAVAVEPAAQPKPAEKKKSKPAASTGEEPVAKSKAAPADKLVDLTGKVVQCHAATSRGVQCKNKTGLATLEKTIDTQKYRFFVCKLHDTDSFKPFPGLL